MRSASSPCVLLPPCASLAAVLLAGCTAEVLHPSVLTDVRVMGVVAEPTEPAPGETLTLELSVANPLDRELELLVWSCTRLEGDCGELMLDDDARWIDVPELVDGRATVSRELPQPSDEWPELSDELVERMLDGGAMGLFVLACEVGRCPIIEDARQQLAGGDSLESWEPLAEALSSPEDWLVDLPFDGVSFATRPVPTRGSTDERVNGNPVATERFLAAGQTTARVEAGGFLDVAFELFDPEDDSVEAWPFTTAGRFEARRGSASDGDIRFWMAAPDEPQQGEIWVVFSDGDGGFDVVDLPLSVE